MLVFCLFVFHSHNGFLEKNGFPLGLEGLSTTQGNGICWHRERASAEEWKICFSFLNNPTFLFPSLLLSVSYTEFVFAHLCIYSFQKQLFSFLGTLKMEEHSLSWKNKTKTTTNMTSPIVIFPSLPSFLSSFLFSITC